MYSKGYQTHYDLYKGSISIYDWERGQGKTSAIIDKFRLNDGSFSADQLCKAIILVPDDSFKATYPNVFQNRLFSFEEFIGTHCSEAEFETVIVDEGLSLDITKGAFLYFLLGRLDCETIIYGTSPQIEWEQISRERNKYLFNNMTNMTKERWSVQNDF